MATWGDAYEAAAREAWSRAERLLMLAYVSGADRRCLDLLGDYAEECRNRFMQATRRRS